MLAVLRCAHDEISPYEVKSFDDTNKIFSIIVVIVSNGRSSSRNYVIIFKDILSRLDDGRRSGRIDVKVASKYLLSG